MSADRVSSKTAGVIESCFTREGLLRLARAGVTVSGVDR
jgi:hypothetical protein